MKNSAGSLKRHLNKYPKDTRALGALAEAYRSQGDAISAISTYRKLLDLEPNNYQALNNYGALLRNIGDIDGSLKTLLRANELLPDHPIILTNMANTYNSLGRYDLAYTACQRAIVRQADFFDAHEMLGNTLLLEGKYTQAIESFQNALRIQPDSISAIVSLARTWHFLGDDNQAYKLIKPLVEAKNSDCALVFYSISKKLGRQDEAVDFINHVLKTKKSLTREATSALKFCLANYYDKNHQYNDAMNNYRQANNLVNRKFDIISTKKHFDKIIENFNREFIDNSETSGVDSNKPIFILGMPRSGTSLVEQILASHPHVFGAGELNNIDLAVKEARLRKNNVKSFPESITSLTSSELNAIANNYLAHVNELAGNNYERITDKMPHNFMHIGFIKMLFPSAYIIHCKRHPLDTCLSCYFSEFGTGGHEYAYNLKSLGEYYLEYERLMSHWTSLYGDSIYQLKYEDLITNHESTCKNLVSYCDLQWSEQCLNFHNNERKVHTLSYDQVNKPIYTDSMYRWKNYEPYINSLIKTLSTVINRY